MEPFYARRPKVLERDIDNILIDRLAKDVEFGRAFVARIAAQTSYPLAYDGVGVDGQVAHAGAPGTIDVQARLWLSVGQESGRLLIENKLDSSFTPNQPERYIASAFALSKPGRPAVAVLCAPQGYLSRSRYAGSFEACVAYEELASWLEGDDRDTVLSAIARFEMPYEPDPVPEVAEFFSGYEELAEKIAPELVLKRNPNTSADRPSGSYTIYFDAQRTLPQHSFLPTLSMSHQCLDKAAPSASVKVLFRTWAQYAAPVIKAAATDLRGTGFYIRRAGDSLGLVCDTPRMDNRRPVSAQVNAVHKGIRAAAKLRAWMFENTTALKRWADLLG